MAIYGTDPFNEAKRIKGQEFDKAYKTTFGMTADDSSSGGARTGSTSTGKGGALDSVAQKHIEDLDVEKEKALLNSKDLINEYSLYINGRIQKAIKQYGDVEKSQIEKRMVEDLTVLEYYVPDEQERMRLIVDEYYGGKYVTEAKEPEKFLRTVLKMRLNYVNKITSLTAKMLQINYKTLGLSEEQAKIYIDNLKSGSNEAVKTVGKVKDLIRQNKDKFVKNEGQQVDLRSLGFGVIFGPTKGYELGFAGTDMSNNEDAMLRLIQSAMRYDAVVVAHGSDDIKAEDFAEDDYKSILNDFKEASESFMADGQNILDKIKSHKNKGSIHLAAKTYRLALQQGLIQLNPKFQDSINEVLEKIVEDKSSDSKVKVFKDLFSKLVDEYFNSDDIQKIIDISQAQTDSPDMANSRLKATSEDNLKQIKNVFENNRDYVEDLCKYQLGELFVATVKQNVVSLADDYKFFWGCQPTKTLSGGPYDDVNDVVRQLIKEGFKKIIIMDCNPGGHKLADDIMKTKGILINYSDFTNYVESSIEDDESLSLINEAESNLRAFAETYGIDYDDDEYLEECSQWYANNYELINEGVIDALKEFFKKILGGIINIFKKAYNYIKSAYIKLKSLFFGSKDNPKDTETKFEKPIKTPLIDINSKKVVEIVSSDRAELTKNANEMCSNMLAVVKTINNKQQSSLKRIENDIKLIEQKPDTPRESFSFIEDFLMDYDDDLLLIESLIHEFQDDQGNVIEDEEEDEGYSVDDEEGTDDSSTEDETPVDPAPDSEEPGETPEDGGGDDEYSMDDVDEEDETSAEPEPTTEEPTEGEEPDDGSGDDAYELPDDEEGEATEDDTSGGEEGEAGGDALGGDDEYSMDDMGEGDDTSGEDTSTDDTSTSSLSNEPASDEASVKLRELESVVFDSLSDAEKRLKIKDLKELYTTVYKKCDIIYNSLSEIKRDEETIQIIEYISNTLIDLKRYVGDYIINLFDIKTYVENLAQLQKYIMIFTAINQVFEQIRIENDK